MALSGSGTGAPVVGAIGDGARRSLKNCRRMLGRRLQSLTVVTVDTNGASDGSSLITKQLINNLDANRYRGWFAMPTDGANAGIVREIGQDALNPTSGTLAIAPGFGSQLLVGQQVELWRLLPPEDRDGILGARQCLNLALAEMWAIDRLAITGVSGQQTYTLDASGLNFGDWLDPEAVAEFYGPIFATGLLPQPWAGYDARRQGNQVLLDVSPGIADGAALKLEVTRPGDTFIRVGGTWTDNQQGFTNDSDECLFQPMILTEVALAHAYESLAGVSTGKQQAIYQQRAADQRVKVNIAKWRGLPHPSERLSHPPFSYSPQNWLEWVK